MSTKNSSVAILGAGPSGLLAAHAAVLAGVEKVAIISRSLGTDPYPQKSKIYGCQYLHRSIPGLDIRRTVVSYQLRGSVEDYRRKVYGPEWDGTVSPEDLEGGHKAWDLRAAYDQLWDRYVLPNSDTSVSAVKVSKANIASLLPYYTFVISTLPAPALCLRPEEHKFKSRWIWAAGDAPDMGIYAPVEIEDNTVVCSGEKDIHWYRASRVFGMTTVEWAGGTKHVESSVPVQKPLETDCSCWSGRIIRMGRYGTWRKGVLTHESFEETLQLFQAAH